jgi:hypothetical protein
MKTFYITIAQSFVCLLFVCNPAFSASLVYSEDFEDGSASDTYGTSYKSYWQQFLSCTDVVKATPHGGDYSFRGLISETGVIDNISGKTGCSNPRTSLGQGATKYGNSRNFAVGEINTGEFYLSWWVKFDTGELSNLLSDSHKMLYMYTNGSTNYIILQVTSSRKLRLFVNADNQAGYPYSSGDNPADSFKYGYGLGTFSDLDDGNWHQIEFYSDWGTGSAPDSRIKIFVDSVVALDVDDAVAIYQTGDRVWTMMLPANVSAAKTKVSSVGWQVDDIEIWDGYP